MWLCLVDGTSLLKWVSYNLHLYPCLEIHRMDLLYRITLDGIAHVESK